MYGAVAANKRNTVLIMAAFIGLVTAVGYVVNLLMGGDVYVTLWILIGAIIYALVQYFMAASLVLAMTGAKEIQKKDNPRLYRIVENLSIATGMPMPKVYIIDDPALNAFATGRDPKHAIVAATTGLVEAMTDRELEAVMAHEMGHVKNYDIRVSMIAFGLVSAVSIIADLVLRMLFYSSSDNRNVHPIVYVVGIIFILLAPVIATIIQLAISRQREYLADATGAMTTRDSEGLAMALEKLKTNGLPLRRQNSSTAHLFFSNPLKPGSFMKLFSTHPPLEDRIARLRKNSNKF
ncbi:M48 family metalloprotease [Candidatus Saccharibacteria bacterium]|jgi:heat shock protein HtpX|nr:M48 family metalloprotease [Candidatus Saccharibacteria bacterium]